MPGGLPPVLITNTETITDEIDNTERVQVEDVARLWRVYTLNSTHIDNDEGTRLENFFWRIWSNPSIIRSIRGNTLARLFINISDGGNRVRTTPVPTPRVSTPTQNVTFPGGNTPQLNVTHISPERSEKSEHPIANPSPVDTSANPRRTPDQARSLQPILKRARMGSDDPPKSARIASPNPQGRNTSVTTACRGSAESAGTLSPPSVFTEKGSKTAGKKKTSFATAGGTRKSRPGAMRKRSSQSSTSIEQRKGSQTSPSPRLQPSKTTPKSGTGLPPVPTIATFALPSSSWQDVDSPSSSRTSLDNTFSTPQQPSSWLVDKNFRGKFVENQKRATSSVNLAALGKSQSVRFLDEMPEYRKAAGKGKSTVKEVEPEPSDMIRRPRRSPPEADTSAIDEEEEEDDDDDDDENDDDDDDDDMLALPRTKSQLSMLIDKERKYSGSTNLGPEPLRLENQSSSRKDNNKEKDDEGEENELLVMARRDKKGKAKDPDQPFKAAAKKGLWKGGLGSDSSDAGEGAGSPPPVF